MPFEKAASFPDPSQMLFTFALLMILSNVWNHIEIMSMKPNDPQNTICFGETSFKNTLKVGDFPLPPCIVIYFCKIPHFNQYVNRCNYVRF